MQEEMPSLDEWLLEKQEQYYRSKREEEQAKRLAIQALLPLPKRVTPWPWEDLASVISRAAQEMGYTTPSWILRPESVSFNIAPANLLWLTGQENYQMLSQLLSLDEAILRSLTLHRFVGERNEANASIREQHWNINLLFSFFQKTTQVCPCCLAEPKSYDRLYWRATPLLLCPRHRVFLLQSCPTCQRSIPALRLSLSTCPYCGGDYRQQVIPLAPETFWLLQTHLDLLTKLGIDASELGESPEQDKPTTLQILPPHEYLWAVTHFFELFEDRLYRTNLAPFLIQALPADTLVQEAPQKPFVILHYLLASWPVHWWVFVERLQNMLQRNQLSWERLLRENNGWRQETDGEQTILFLQAFFEAIKLSFPEKSRDLTSRKLQVASSEILLAHQLRSPNQADMVQPFLWEDLASVISRVARNMHYEDPAWLLISRDAPCWKVYSLDIPLLYHSDDYRLLAYQLGLDEKTLYQLTLHRFAARLQPPTEEASPTLTFSELYGLPILSDAVRWTYCPTLHSTKICPICLEEERGYDRLFWRLSPVILCSVHSLLLIDECSHCKKSIPALRPAVTRCPYCQHDYRHSQRIQIPSTSWLSAGQALFFQQLTSEQVGCGEGPEAFIDSPVLLIQPWQYFSLWVYFKHLLESFDQTLVIQTLEKLAWDGRSANGWSWSIRRGAQQTALFHFLLASWPENLLNFLAQMASHPPPPRSSYKKGLDEYFWRFDQLLLHLWSTIAREDTSFAFLSRLFETLHKWAVLSPLPPQ